MELGFYCLLAIAFKQAGLLSRLDTWDWPFSNVPKQKPRFPSDPNCRAPVALVGDSKHTDDWASPAFRVTC